MGLLAGIAAGAAKVAGKIYRGIKKGRARRKARRAARAAAAEAKSVAREEKLQELQAKIAGSLGLDPQNEPADQSPQGDITSRFGADFLERIGGRGTLDEQAAENGNVSRAATGLGGNTIVMIALAALAFLFLFRRK